MKRSATEFLSMGFAVAEIVGAEPGFAQFKAFGRYMTRDRLKAMFPWLRFGPIYRPI